jgi:hypothetical protein
LSVQRGIESALFGPVFEHAVHISSLLRNCKNLFRRLRTDQVELPYFIPSCHPCVSFVYPARYVVLDGIVGITECANDYAGNVCSLSLAVQAPGSLQFGQE